MFITEFDKEKLLQFIKLGKPHLAGSLFFYFSIGALLAVLFNAPFDLSKFILGWIVIFLSGWAVHYHNDYFDFETDHNTKPTAISGGSGILIEHPEWKRASIIMAITLITLSIALSTAFTFIFSYPLTFTLFIIIGNIIAWFYAAPPIKLSYRGLGEFGNATIGLIFPGVGYFALMGTLNLPFFIFAIPMLFLQMLFANSVEIPDMEGDKIGGKITWIVSRGRKFGYKIIAISGLMVTISFLSLSLTGIFPSNIDFRILAIISLIPLSLGIIELIKKPVDKISATKFCTYNLASIIITAILINFYFVYLIV